MHSFLIANRFGLGHTAIMTKGKFVQYYDGDAADILDKLNALIPAAPFDTACSKVLAGPLSFYPSAQMIHVTGHQDGQAREARAVLINGKDMILIDGLPVTIAKIHEKAGLSLNPENIFDYIQFYFDNVQGVHGKFILIYNANDIPWRDYPLPKAIQSLNSLISPLTLERERPEAFFVSGTVLFKDALFEIDMIIGKDGSLSIPAQDMIIEDIPVILP